MCVLRGALLSAELSQRTALGILTALSPGAPTPEFWCPFLRDHCQRSIQLLTDGHPAAPGAWEARGDSHSSLDPGIPPPAHGPWARRRRRARRLRARSCERGEGARPAVPSSTALVAPGPARGPGSALPPPGRPGPAPLGAARAGAAPPPPAFPPPSSPPPPPSPGNPRSPNRFRLAKVPRKAARGVCAAWGRTRGRTSRGGGEEEGGARRRGPAPFLHVAAAAAELGGGRGRRLPRQRVAGRIAQYSRRGRGRSRGWGRAPG